MSPPPSGAVRVPSGAMRVPSGAVRDPPGAVRVPSGAVRVPLSEKPPVLSIALGARQRSILRALTVFVPGAGPAACGSAGRVSAGRAGGAAGRASGESGEARKLRLPGRSLVGSAWKPSSEHERRR